MPAARMSIAKLVVPSKWQLFMLIVDSSRRVLNGVSTSLESLISTAVACRLSNFAQKRTYPKVNRVDDIFTWTQILPESESFISGATSRGKSTKVYRPVFASDLDKAGDTSILGDLFGNDCVDSKRHLFFNAAYCYTNCHYDTDWNVYLCARGRSCS